jgi:metal-responsive CopG/Arc/MetJ family transcriptional regulator
MLDDANMASKAIQISLDETLLRRVDREPQVRREGRSAFVRSAIELYLRAKERQSIDDSIRRAYSGTPRELEAEVADLLGAQARYGHRRRDHVYAQGSRDRSSAGPR